MRKNAYVGKRKIRKKPGRNDLTPRFTSILLGASQPILSIKARQRKEKRGDWRGKKEDQKGLGRCGTGGTLDAKETIKSETALEEVASNDGSRQKRSDQEARGAANAETVRDFNRLN